MLLDDYGTPEYYNRQNRNTALHLAATTYGADHPPQAIVEAAQIFYDFLSLEPDEVQG